MTTSICLLLHGRILLLDIHDNNDIDVCVTEYEEYINEGEVAAENKVAGGGERPWRNSPPMVKLLGQQLQVQMKIYVSMIET